LYGRDYLQDASDWLATLEEKGLQETLEYEGNPPNQDEYMPSWPEEQRTHWMMYEDVSEGTPISPAFETPEELARWLADTGASALGGDTATYDQWLATIRAGSAVSMVVNNGVIISGVAAMEGR
jgi:hypothetical protein